MRSIRNIAGAISVVFAAATATLAAGQPTDSLSQAVAQARDAQVAAGTDALKAETAVRGAVQAFLAEKAKSAEEGLAMISLARVTLGCPTPERRTANLVTCPTWVDAALRTTVAQIGQARQGPSSTGESSVLSMPPPPALNAGGGGGGASYRAN